MQERKRYLATAIFQEKNGPSKDSFRFTYISEILSPWWHPTINSLIFKIEFQILVTNTPCETLSMQHGSCRHKVPLTQPAAEHLKRLSVVLTLVEEMQISSQATRQKIVSHYLLFL